MARPPKGYPSRSEEGENIMKVLYFAELKEILNQSSEEIDTQKTMTVQEFEAYLFEQHPEIESKKFQVAVNEEFVRKDDIVQPQDTVALIPPVSGG
ncbi:molybdopterin synthase (small subunit) [Staphylococcus capitis]|nr:molybdopterin synthase (small subunit) [Staphylococcus capitis CR01]CQD26794.1 molybdopterin synthase (small subunit) [Staphylococcus capitis]CQD28597.1 molybdopterin synthase (small subunit) [Staphylococcus capitis]CQD34086.1 molybdopterin synthase (small subunit) [Staphylococcus capitis]CRN10679.1 molybdopterin synthase (small subunit) [Staphylococcus capitis]